MMNTPQNEMTENSASPSPSSVANPGEILRQARERKGMSLSHVANQLHFTENALRLLEDGAFDQLPGHTFSRGYIRAYAKLVNLDQSEMVNLFDRYTGTDSSGSTVQNIERVEEPMTMSRYILLFVSLLLLILLIGVSYYWWSGHSTSTVDSGLSLERVEVESADGTTEIHTIDEPDEQLVLEGQHGTLPAPAALPPEGMTQLEQQGVQSGDLTPPESVSPAVEGSEAAPTEVPSVPAAVRPPPVQTMAPIESQAGVPPQEAAAPVSVPAATPDPSPASVPASALSTTPAPAPSVTPAPTPSTPSPTPPVAAQPTAAIPVPEPIVLPRVGTPMPPANERRDSTLASIRIPPIPLGDALQSVEEPDTVTDSATPEPTTTASPMTPAQALARARGRDQPTPNRNANNRRRAASPPAAETTENKADTALFVSIPDQGRVTVRFDADCWIQLTDANGQVLASGLRRQGNVVDIAGKKPLQLRLGYAPGVRVSFNGRPVNVQAYTSGETATLILGQ